MSSEMLTTGEAAKICCVTPDTILKWIRSGRVQATRTPGGHHRISRKDLIKVMIAKEQNGTTGEPRLKAHHFKYCWEFNGNGELKEGCRECIVYQMRAKRCYEVVDRAKEIGHNKLFCDKTCAHCDYYKLVHRQSTNVLLVTDNEIMAENLRRTASSEDFNLEITDCEYTTSALVFEFRPDFAIVDCSLGKQRTKDICDHLLADPRIPYVRVVLAAGEGEYPQECDKEIFARLLKPFSAEDVSQCVKGDWGEKLSDAS